MAAQRTYWHLEQLRRKPTAYDIATSRLLYHHSQGLEIPTPAAEWIERYQRNSPLQANDWERFSDPRHTTYSSYTELQRAQESYLDGLFHSIASTGYDSQLSAAWIATLEGILPVLRFPLHGLQMVSAYVGHLAPASRIVITALLQTTDEIRRIQRFAYRMRALQDSWPDFGMRSREQWQSEPKWQGLRELVEKLLVTYDWGEALVALNLCVKPAFDEVFHGELARFAERHGDHLLARLLFAFDDDCRWHREWSRALLDMVLEDSPQSATVIGQWEDKWRAKTQPALSQFSAQFSSAT